MNEKKYDYIYNKKYLVIIPKMSEEYYDAFSYTFNNTILMNNTIDDINYVTDYINNNNFDQLIFVDYQAEFERIFLNLNKRHTIKYIYTKSLGGLSNLFYYSIFNSIYDNYKKGKTSRIGFLDYGLYTVLKNKGDNVDYIKLDIERENRDEECNGSLIGVINNSVNDRHSYYNELSAIKLSNKYIPHIIKPYEVTEGFLDTFNMEYVFENSIDKVFHNNIINLYINFTDNNYTLFIKSMDLGIPCILGNSCLLDDYKYLHDMLVVNSDDNVNEIAEKIDTVVSNKDEILKEYDKFREDYSESCNKLATEFLNVEIEHEQKSEEYEKLISAIVPVYNTSEYLEKSLNSIIKAIPDNSEILIINDGSTDGSKNIINKYEKKYPELIRAIHQKNHGLGNVRNVGLREAKGKYIASIDSDDTINPNFFDEAVEHLKNDVDIVICDWLTVTNDSNYETAALDYVFKDINKYEGLLYTTIMPSTCNKIIKKSLFDELKLTYKEDKYEDLSTNPIIMLRAKTIKYINKPYYEYYIRSNSIMRSSAGLSMIDVIKFLDDRVNHYKEYVNVDIEKFKFYTYAWRIEEYVMNQLYSLDEKEIKKFIDHINTNIRDIIIDIFSSKYYKDVLNTLKEKDRDYILKRNKAFEKNKLLEFIIKSRKDDKYFKLTPVIMYYGDNNS